MPRHVLLAALPVLAFSVPAFAQTQPAAPYPYVSEPPASSVPAQYQPPPPPGPITTEPAGSGTSYPPPPMSAATNPGAGGPGYPPPPNYPSHPVDLVPSTTVPSPGFVWIPGHYNWDPVQHNYVWLVGQYMQRPHQGAQWIPGRWNLEPGGWVWIDGHWS